MSKKLYEEQNIINIADAIRRKLVTSRTFLVSQMAEAINQIVVPVMQSITITDNGTFFPEAGIAGFDKVIVNVEHVVKLQTKTATYNQVVVPDSEYDGLEKVIVAVDSGEIHGLRSEVESTYVNAAGALTWDISAYAEA